MAKSHHHCVQPNQKLWELECRGYICDEAYLHLQISTTAQVSVFQQLGSCYLKSVVVKAGCVWFRKQVLSCAHSATLLGINEAALFHAVFSLLLTTFSSSADCGMTSSIFLPYFVLFPGFGFECFWISLVKSQFTIFKMYGAVEESGWVEICWIIYYQKLCMKYLGTPFEFSKQLET